MIVHKCEQGSEKWIRLRLGIPTASRFSEVLTPAKLQLVKQPSAYLFELLAEWISGQELEAFTSPWMERGLALEADAIKYFEFATGLEAQKVGFVTTDDGMIGASPDRLVGDEALLEQKCPAPKKHVEYLYDSQRLVADYQLQIQGQLWVTERARSYVQSFCPPYPSVIVEVPRDEAIIAPLSKAVREFVGTMIEARERMTREYGDFRPAVPPRAAPAPLSDADFDALSRGVV